MKLALVFAAGVLLAVIGSRAEATPLAAAKQLSQGNTVTLVAEGCGRHWHWSHRRHRCVPD